MAVDIGNTQTVLGLFDGEEPRGQWRVATEAHRTADELAVVYAALLQMRGLQLGDVDAMIVSSVVPALARSHTDLASKFFDVPFYGVTAGMKTDLTNRYDDPGSVGAARLVYARGSGRHQGV